MRYLITIGFVGFLAAVSLLGGCSCEDPEATAPQNRIVQVEGGDEEAEPKEEQPARTGRQETRPQTDGRRDVGENVLDAPADYLRTTTVTAPRAAKRKVNLSYLQNEIKQWWAMKGRYPKSLDELEEWRGTELPECPTGYEYDYDASEGKLEVVRKR